MATTRKKTVAKKPTKKAKPAAKKTKKPPRKPPTRQIHQAIEDILDGLPEADPSDEPDYNDGTGVKIDASNIAGVRGMTASMGGARPSSIVDVQNITAMINTLTVRVEAGEELHRRSIQALGEMQMRLKVLEDRLGIAKGMRI